MNADIPIIKLNPDGQEMRRYSGRVIRRLPGAALVEATFTFPDLPFHGMLLGQGDRFLELYFSNRWYNIFEIYSRDDGNLRGWYCNIGRPAVITPQSISYVDLALDLLVFPDRRQLVLDEEEFFALNLHPRTRRKALTALADLRAWFTQGFSPLQNLSAAAGMVKAPDHSADQPSAIRWPAKKAGAGG